MKWKPIETAPTGEAILVRRDNGDTELLSEEENDFNWQAYDGKNQNRVGISKPVYWMAVYELPSPK